MKNYDLPTSFTTSDPVRLARELERLAAALSDYMADAPSLFRPFYTIQDIVSKGTVIAYFDSISRVEPQNDNDVDIILPVVDPNNAGHDLIIMHRTSSDVLVEAPSGSTINNNANITLTTSAYVTFDGLKYTAVAL